MEIRALTPTDIDAYIPLRLEMLTEAPLAFGSSPGHDRAGDGAHLRAALGPEFVIMGAWDGPRLVGAGGLMRPGAPKRRHIAEVWGVYVRPEARRRGCARGMMREMIARACGWEGVRSIRLSVSSEARAAEALYASLGFVTWGIEPDCTRLPGQGEAAGPSEHHMMLVL